MNTVNILLLTGNEYHDWRATAPALKEALEEDERLKVTVSENIEDLAGRDLKPFGLILLNYCNWQSPGLSEAAKEGFVSYLTRGGGLIIHHFSNGAFHYSLPDAGEGDWPEYRRICRRVWDHHSDSSHDPYREFTVRITATPHPITAGLADFQITDELYYNQKGDQPIEPLLSATSANTGREEPLAWAYTYEKARVFQNLLGHDAAAVRAPGFGQVTRRAALWVAGAL